MAPEEEMIYADKFKDPNGLTYTLDTTRVEYEEDGETKSRRYISIQEEGKDDKSRAIIPLFTKEDMVLGSKIMRRLGIEGVIGRFHKNYINEDYVAEKNIKAEEAYEFTEEAIDQIKKDEMREMYKESTQRITKGDGVEPLKGAVKSKLEEKTEKILKNPAGDLPIEDI